MGLGDKKKEDGRNVNDNGMTAEGRGWTQIYDRNRKLRIECWLLGGQDGRADERFWIELNRNRGNGEFFMLMGGRRGEERGRERSRGKLFRRQPG